LSGSLVSLLNLQRAQVRMARLAEAGVQASLLLNDHTFATGVVTIDGVKYTFNSWDKLVDQLEVAWQIYQVWKSMEGFGPFGNVSSTTPL
jgi:hypothetical protein